MRAAAQHSDSRIGGQRFDQSGDQHEMTDVVGEELQFVAVGLVELRRRHDPSVADDPVDWNVQRLDRCDGRADRGRLGEFARDGRRRSFHRSAGSPRLLQGPRGGDYMGSAQRQHAKSFKSEAGTAAR